MAENYEYIHNICPNCSSESTVILNEVDSQSSMLLTSDVQCLNNIHAKRFLCEHCGCISVRFSKDFSLDDFYKTKYITDEKVQDHFIISGKRLKSKHKHLQGKLFKNGLLNISKGAILEIACGKGDLIRQFSKDNPGWECWAIDPSIDKQLFINDSEIRYIKDIFKDEYFERNYFDIVIAHGLLNRAPVLDTLRQIGLCANKGALISLEVMLLENSHCIPYIWDHTYMFTMKVFQYYLESNGFEILEIENMGPSYHFMCKFSVSDKEKYFKSGKVDYRLLDDTKSQYQEHVKWWESAFKNFNTVVNRNKQICLFGAGMYSAILMSGLNSPNAVKYIIDEIKTGSFLNNIPIIDIIDAKIVCSNIALLVRPEYLKLIINKLKENGINFTVINPEK